MLDLALGAPVGAALLIPHSASTHTTRPAPLAAAPVENDLHRVVAAEGPPQRFIEIRPLAPDDEEEPPDRIGHMPTSGST
jgi:hypothetical protein